MNLFIVKEWMKVSLWLLGACVAGGVGVCVFRWCEAKDLVGGHDFLQAVTLTVALTLAWLILFVSFLVARHELRHKGPPVRNLIEGVPWWTVKFVFLIILIASLAVAVSRLSIADSFSLLKEDQLVQLERMIRENPKVLEKAEATSGKTLLECALESGNAKAVELLLVSGANLEWVITGSEWIMPLENLQILRLLLKFGVDPDMLDSRGKAPIHRATEKGNAGAVAMLIEAGADVAVRDPAARTPLMLAIMTGHLALAETLLDAGADPNQWDKLGDFPLHQAVRQRNSEAIKLLLKNSVDPSAFNFSGMAPVHLAAISGQKKLVELFLEYPDMVSLRDKEGRTPFNHALRGYKYDAARLLLRHGADINRIMADGYGAIHITIIDDDYEAAEFLIAEGADVYLASVDGETAYDMMRSRQMQSLLDLIEARDNSSRSNTVDAVDSSL